MCISWAMNRVECVYNFGAPRCLCTVAITSVLSTSLSIGIGVYDKEQIQSKDIGYCSDLDGIFADYGHTTKWCEAMGYDPQYIQSDKLY